MSYSPSGQIIGLVSRGLDEIAGLRAIEDGVIVTTHCMYPSNGLVRVVVRGGENTIIATDDGGAMEEATGAGIAFRDYNRQLSHLIKDNGLLISEGVIRTPKMPIEAAPLAVLHVANASQEIARWMFDHAKIKRTRDFKALLADFLAKRFDDRVDHNAIIVGHSTKPHKFANVVNLGHEKRLIIDPVAHEASSINARVIANLDVKAVEDPNIIQRIIYDDEESWSPADLNLLQVGAPVIAFSKASQVIERIALNA
jgi:hypothetical protein